MHVILVLDHAHINGGQAKVAIDSALGLRARGHDVTLFAAVGPIDPRLPEAGVEVICLGQPDVDTARSKLAFAAQVIWNGAAAQALGERIARCDPARTLVHVHGWAKALSSAIGPAIARSGLPAVYTVHEFFLVCPNGGFYDYPRAEICHRRSMSTACVGHNCDSRNYPRKLLRVARHAALDHVSRMRDTIRHVVLISGLQREVSARYFRRRRCSIGWTTRSLCRTWAASRVGRHLPLCRPSLAGEGGRDLRRSRQARRQRRLGQ